MVTYGDTSDRTQRWSTCLRCKSADYQQEVGHILPESLAPDHWGAQMLVMHLFLLGVPLHTVQCPYNDVLRQRSGWRRYRNDWATVQFYWDLLLLDNSQVFCRVTMVIKLDHANSGCIDQIKYWISQHRSNQDECGELWLHPLDLGTSFCEGKLLN